VYSSGIQSTPNAAVTTEELIDPIPPRIRLLIITPHIFRNLSSERKNRNPQNPIVGENKHESVSINDSEEEQGQ
jgi:hypothetical protein